MNDEPELPHQDFHEIWWIYAPERHPWGGLRLAHFRKTIDGTVIVIITGETDTRRIGPRVWEDVAPREGWVKVKPIELPTRVEVEAAIDRAIRHVAAKITKEAGF
jgi:hypothetical protein